MTTPGSWTGAGSATGCATGCRLPAQGLIDRRIGVPARGDRILPVEVKAARLGRPVFSRSLRSFLDAYRPATALVVNTGLAHRDRAAAREVEWILPMHLAEPVEGLFVG